MALGCGQHTVVITERGGTKVLGEVPKLVNVEWERVRDDISHAQFRSAATGQCCDVLGAASTGFHELHIYRDGTPVWEGPITRIEYERDHIDVFAEDILWVAKNTALSTGYNHAHPNIVKGGWVMNWLLKDMTFNKDGDPWKAAAHVHWMTGSDDPSTTAAVKAWSMTTWEDFDKFAEDRGMDYTVAGRDIYFWDTHLKWRTLPQPLLEQWLPEGLALVEYGNEFATRVIVTNGNGYYAARQAPAWGISKYRYIDHVASSYNESAANEVPTTEELKAWGEQAQSLLDSSFPAPVRVRVPENSGLSPLAPYDINDLIAGAWVEVVAQSLCRQTDQWHKIDNVKVSEENGDEVVTVSTVVAPEDAVEP